MERPNFKLYTFKLMSLATVMILSIIISILHLVHPALAIEATQGTECEVCQFPTAVRLSSHCSGVYVGNGIVLTAAHCVPNGSTSSRILFGESEFDPFMRVPILSCTRYPGGHTTTHGISPGFGYDGVDLAFCELDLTNIDFPGNEISDFPPLHVVPPMLPDGCAAAWLAHEVYEQGEDPIVTAVGSGCGRSYNGGTHCDAGIKRFLPVRLAKQFCYDASCTKLSLTTANDTPSTGIRTGDSGGPVFERLPDKTWRLLCVLHNSHTCEAVPPYLNWIESNSGKDITPGANYNADIGAWGNYPAGTLPLHTHLGGQSWSAGCPTGVGGGPYWLIEKDGLCSGFKSSFSDQLTVASQGSVSIPKEKFQLEVGKLLGKSDRKSPRNIESVVETNFRKLTIREGVFPFLMNKLPNHISLSKDQVGALF